MDLDTLVNHQPNDAAVVDKHTLLNALLFDYYGDWDTAHSIAQDDPSSEGSWVHAYLHRKEGDKFNAEYWYSRAGKSFPNKSLEEEWKELALFFLKR